MQYCTSQPGRYVIALSTAVERNGIILFGRLGFSGALLTGVLETDPRDVTSPPA